MASPKVSVPITCYNQADYIAEAVMSAINQNYDNLEIVVSDDASTDNSRDILRDLQLKFPGRLNVHFNKTNLGAAENRNIVFSLSNGKYITYLDGDDIFLPGKINKQVEFMEGNPDCELSYHNVIVFDNYLNKDLFEWKDRFGYGDGNINKLIQRGNYLCSLSTMFLRKNLPQIGFIDQLGGLADWYFFVQLLNNGNGKFFYIDEVLAKYRRHSSNLTLNWENKIASQYRAIEIIEDKHPLYKKDALLRKSDLMLIDVVYNFRNRKFIDSVVLLFESFSIVFPKVWRLLRIPFREVKYLVQKKGLLDPLLSSLFNKSE